MDNHNQSGYINALIIPLVLVVLLLIMAAGFGLWAYSSRQDYKNNTDQKIASAVDTAREQEAAAKDKEFVEKEKQPLRTYTGPAEYGSVVIKYPKTWSAYVSDSGSGTLVDGYFHPGTVPYVSDRNNSFALRLEVVSQGYSDVVGDFSSKVENGKVKIRPYQAPKVSGIVGVRIDGEIITDKQGSMIVLPLRDKTLELWTEADKFKKDFDTNILPNFSFEP